MSLGSIFVSYEKLFVSLVLKIVASFSFCIKDSWKKFFFFGCSYLSNVTKTFLDLPLGRHLLNFCVNKILISQKMFALYSWVLKTSGAMLNNFWIFESKIPNLIKTHYLLISRIFFHRFVLC